MPMLAYADSYLYPCPSLCLSHILILAPVQMTGPTLVFIVMPLLIPVPSRVAFAWCGGASSQSEVGLRGGWLQAVRDGFVLKDEVWGHTKG